MFYEQKYLCSTPTYGSETLTISKTLKNKINAAELWFYRRMLRISWTDRITNEEVLGRVNQQRTLLRVIRKRQMEFLGHVIRREKITGMIEGRRSRGRQRKK